MVNKFIDVSSWNLDSEAYFRAAKAWGAKAVVVKSSEGSANGSAYRNPKARTQIANAQKVGLLTHLYHYFLGVSVQDSKDEASFFVQVARELGVDPQKTIMAVDVEDNSLTEDRQQLTNFVNAFMDEVRRLGFPHVIVYTGRYWAQTRLYTDQLSTGYLWLAEYGVNQCALHCQAWQYASNTQFLGNATDTNYDYDGFVTNPINNNPQKNGEYNENGSWYYYKDGQKVTGWLWVDPPGKTCYYDREGRMVYGWQNIDNHRYYFDKVTGEMKRGFFTDPDDGVKYYFNPDGWLLYGNIWVDNKHYYAIETTGEIMHNLKFDHNGVCTTYEE